jgi:hypothetical protein
MSSCFLYINDEDTERKINIDDLYEKRHRQDLRQLSIFNKILNRIHNRIEKTGRFKSRDRHIWFQVPEYLFGEPLYDQPHCLAYLVSKLENNGFYVRYIHPNTLFISWEHWVPSYVRNEIRKKTGVVIDEQGQIVQPEKPALPPPAPAAAAAPKEKDKNYISTKQYKPNGNLVYDPALFDKIERRVSFS